MHKGSTDGAPKLNEGQVNIRMSVHSYREAVYSGNSVERAMS